MLGQENQSWSQMDLNPTHHHPLHKFLFRYTKQQCAILKYDIKLILRHRLLPVLLVSS